MPEGALAALAAVLGLIFGSFASVVAYRVPRGESFARGRSRCPSCGHPIAPRDNIPLFSYLLLGGRCRNCGARISPRYPLTEVATALLFVLAAIKFDLTVEGFLYAGLFWVLVVLTVIDLETRRLPDVITLPAFAAGAVGLTIAAVDDDRFGRFSVVLVIGLVVVAGVIFAMYDFKTLLGRAPREEPDAVAPRGFDPFGLLFIAAWTALLVAAFIDGEQVSLAGATIGAALFAGFFFAVVFAYQRGMGPGDAKLGLLLGAFCGYLGSPGYVVVALFASFLLGGLISIAVLLTGGSRKTALPFGPFLALGAVVAIFWGEGIQDFYTGGL
jgi:leader peptidase (prepilin peptidase) / N-methyltransferase